MENLNLLLETYIGIMPQSTEEKVLRLLIETGVQIVGGAEGSLLALDEKTNELRFLMTVGSKSSEEALIGQCVPLGKGITGLAASTHEVQIGAPTFADIKQSEERADKSSLPEAVIAAPMLIGDMLIGVITVVSFEKGKRFAGNDAKLLGRFATIAGLILHQKRKLSVLGSKSIDDLNLPKALGETARLEQSIIHIIIRLIRQKPAELGKIEKMLQAIENITSPDEV
ncbi:MAG: GAF domain-containing protein [Deltaproteobacteria bacterium]